MAGVHINDKRALWGAALSGMAIGAFARAALRPGHRVGLKEVRTGTAGLEAGRGRHAAHPHEIPVKGWRDIVLRTGKAFFANRVLSLAAGVTFYALLATFPALAAIISLYGLFLNPSTIQGQLEAAAWVLPAGAIEVMRDQILRLTATETSSLGWRFLFSLGVALWSANAATKAMIEALNLVYEEEERRSFLRLTLVTLTFTVGAVLFAVIALATVVVLPLLLNVLHLPPGTERLITLLRWPALAVIVALLITIIYRFGPSRERPQWKWVSLGSAVAAVLWLATSAGFSLYVSRYASYEQTYGSLGAVIGFMVWIWLSMTVLLLGAELNAEIEHQTARDTTTGPPLPLGLRGAHMADTVGAAQD